MSILDLLYREYCRARLAEMRKQLLVPVVGDEIFATNWDATNPAIGTDQTDRLNDDDATSDVAIVR